MFISKEDCIHDGFCFVLMQELCSVSPGTSSLSSSAGSRREVGFMSTSINDCVICMSVHADSVGLSHACRFKAILPCYKLCSAWNSSFLLDAV
jgi:hypothetical protein